MARTGHLLEDLRSQPQPAGGRAERRRGSSLRSCFVGVELRRFDERGGELEESGGRSLGKVGPGPVLLVSRRPVEGGGKKRKKIVEMKKS